MTRLAFVALVLAACRPPPTDRALEVRPRPLPATEAVTERAPGEAGSTTGAPAAPRVLTRVSPRLGGPVLLARDGETTIAYIADEDARTIRVVDVDAQDERSAMALPGRPAQLAMLDDHRLVATLRDRNELAVLAGTGLTDAPL